jgi:large subunit ribosomal protein L1
MAKGKKYRDAARRYDREMFHGPREALELVKSLATKNFDESIDLVVRLGVDPRKADQMVRGTVSLPSGSGKNVRVAVFAEGEQAEAARAAGADFVGGEELAAEIQGGMMDFDLTIASPDMMPIVGKLGRVLGPRGLMPNPKTGTVTPDVATCGWRVQGRQGRVPHRPARQRGTSRSARRASSPTRWRPTWPPSWARSFAPSRRRPRASTSRRSPCPPRWAPASAWTPAPTTPSRQRFGAGRRLR